MKKLLQLSFVPSSADLGLLLLRLWLGGSMMILHGWMKLHSFSAMSGKFPGLLGLSPTASLALATFGEFVCAGLLALGLFTRLSALVAAIVMGVAFFMAHGGQLTGPGSGELAYIYLGGFVALFFTGPGRFSIDRKLGASA